jgi:hypothetical protein
MTAKSRVIKDRGGKFGGCAGKAVDLTSGGLRCVRNRTECAVRRMIATQKSAEGIVGRRKPNEGPNVGSDK